MKRESRFIWAFALGLAASSPSVVRAGEPSPGVLAPFSVAELETNIAGLVQSGTSSPAERQETFVAVFTDLVSLGQSYQETPEDYNDFAAAHPSLVRSLHLLYSDPRYAGRLPELPSGLVKKMSPFLPPGSPLSRGKGKPPLERRVHASPALRQLRRFGSGASDGVNAAGGRGTAAPPPRGAARPNTLRAAAVPGPEGRDERPGSGIKPVRTWGEGYAAVGMEMRRINTKWLGSTLENSSSWFPMPPYTVPLSQRTEWAQSVSDKAERISRWLESDTGQSNLINRTLGRAMIFSVRGVAAPWLGGGTWLKADTPSTESEIKLGRAVTSPLTRGAGNVAALALAPEAVAVTVVDAAAGTLQGEKESAKQLSDISYVGAQAAMAVASGGASAAMSAGRGATLRPGLVAAGRGVDRVGSFVFTGQTALDAKERWEGATMGEKALSVWLVALGGLGTAFPALSNLPQGAIKSSVKQAARAPKPGTLAQVPPAPKAGPAAAAKPQARRPLLGKRAPPTAAPAVEIKAGAKDVPLGHVDSKFKGAKGEILSIDDKTGMAKVRVRAEGSDGGARIREELIPLQDLRRAGPAAAPPAAAPTASAKAAPAAAAQAPGGQPRPRSQDPLGLRRKAAAAGASEASLEKGAEVVLPPEHGGGVAVISKIEGDAAVVERASVPSPSGKVELFRKKIPLAELRRAPAEGAAQAPAAAAASEAAPRAGQARVPAAAPPVQFKKFDAVEFSLDDGTAIVATVERIEGDTAYLSRFYNTTGRSSHTGELERFSVPVSKLRRPGPIKGGDEVSFLVQERGRTREVLGVVDRIEGNKARIRGLSDERFNLRDAPPASAWSEFEIPVSELERIPARSPAAPRRGPMRGAQPKPASSPKAPVRPEFDLYDEVEFQLPGGGKATGWIDEMAGDDVVVKTWRDGVLRNFKVPKAKIQKLPGAP